MAGFNLPDLSDNPNPFHVPAYDLTGAGYSTFRMVVDAAYVELDAVLSEVYHRCWKHGISAPWGNWDTLNDPVADRRQFNTLCSLLQACHMISLDALNTLGVIPEAAYRWYTSEGEVQKDAVAEARDLIPQLEVELGAPLGDLIAHFQALVQHYTGVDVSGAFSCQSS